jgi:arrestin-related trafficking adapter 3/6
MTSYHSLFWSPTQIGFVQIRSDSGRLFYLPPYLPREDIPGPGFFVDRPRRPHRIHIARVRPDYGLRDECRNIKSRSTISILFEKSFDKAFGKLANPRDNAKRFLRSFIASPQYNPSIIDQLATSEPQINNPSKRRTWRGKRRSIIEAESMRTSARSSVIDPVASTSMLSTRPSLVDNSALWSASGQDLASVSAGRIPDEKPLASGNGVNVGISLAEPVLFLQGFEQADLSQRSTTMLRGSLHLKVTKAAKLKAVTLKFKGQATTKWPEGWFSTAVSLVNKS